MANVSNCVLVAITETKPLIEKMAGDTVENRLKKAMQEMRNHWLVTNQDEQFQAAVGAVLLTATEEEKERINTELKMMKALNAVADGVPVDMNQAFKSMDKSKLVGLMKIWKEVLTPQEQ